MHNLYLDSTLMMYVLIYMNKIMSHHVGGDISANNQETFGGIYEIMQCWNDLLTAGDIGAFMFNSQPFFNVINIDIEGVRITWHLLDLR